MTVAQIIATVRRYLGGAKKGIWTDEEIIAWLVEACDEHAQRALSVRKTVYCSSIYGIQNYVLPDDFGELLAVRYQYEGREGSRRLMYVTKQVIRDWGYSGAELGEPEFYYKDNDSLVGDRIGLYPIPNKPRVFERVFEGNCPYFAPMLTDRGARYPTLPTEFSNLIELSIVESEEQEIEGTELDPCRVWVSQVDLYLRREGHPYPGEIHLSIAPTGEDAHSNHVSQMIPAAYIDSRPNWIPFDFGENPIVIDETLRRFKMELSGDTDYLFPQGTQLDDPESVVSRLGGRGVLIGTDTPMGDDTMPPAYIRFNRLRNDIEVEYYRNTCDPVSEMTDIPQTPVRYHKTHWKQVLAKAYLKDGYDMLLSDRWQAEADAEIAFARTQAVVPTIGDRLEIRGRQRLLPNFVYDKNTKIARVRL